ncbi:MAG TPA: Uma2 family endonuclease [Thermoanaerobaculia bacterium]|nr:Uma2 family endonuclease [Thermoanaerobaculia bacterium]
MVHPLRKLPADEDPEAVSWRTDPFRYGSRWKRTRLPNGDIDEQEIPLTAEDLLDPQLGDEVTQSDPHFEFLLRLAGLLRGHYGVRNDVLVAGDMKMFWGIPGLKEPSPDIAIIPGVRKKYDPDRGSFDAAREGALPCLIIEIVSATDAEVRRNDYEKKVEIYQQVGIPEYLILDPPTSFTQGRLLWTGYRQGADGRYRRIAPDRDGLLLSETTGLLFGTGKDGETLLIVDARTGERLLEPREQVVREAEARKAAEQQMRFEAEARKAVEEENARLRAELDRLKNR